MEIINENGIKFNTDELFNVSRARLPRDTIRSNNKVYIKRGVQNPCDARAIAYFCIGLRIIRFVRLFVLCLCLCLYILSLCIIYHIFSIVCHAKYLYFLL